MLLSIPLTCCIHVFIFAQFQKELSLFKSYFYVLLLFARNSCCQFVSNYIDKKHDFVSYHHSSVKQFNFNNLNNLILLKFNVFFYQATEGKKKR